MADPTEDLSREKEGCGNACVNACSMLSGTVDVHLMELISDESDAVVMRNVKKKIYGESFFGVHKYPRNTRRLSGHLPCASTCAMAHGLCTLCVVRSAGRMKPAKCVT